MRNESPVVVALRTVLADAHVLYFKTHAFHWNVTGPHFKSLHDMFGDQYTEIWNAIDEIAERIRMLGALAPSTHAELSAPATLKEAQGTPSAAQMVAALAADNRAIVATLYTALKAAQEADDEGTVALVTARIEAHEKAAWMLEASAAS
ncbi:MAG TPA: DNA starvation/stationary phase protection protein [Rhodospirillaceae bacterium]|jgi:starvation-inducible DNA-binding protein|nr:DNA starvation/stationary phase protection protein [Alphaproteobacteria bacterium]HBH26698.1 DNA starvation/stationary phase protection protein [Rhodospirillaceae bacterium]